MRRARWAALLLLLLTTPVLAQTASPSPSPSPQPTSGAQATLVALPTYAAGGVVATLTPFPTANWPTLTPNALVPQPWIGVGLVEMTPGGGYDPPAFPALDDPDLPGIQTANGFQGINDRNTAGFMVYLMDVAMSFYAWFAANFPRVVVGARWLVIIMIVLYGIFLLWRGSKFAPPDQESRDEQYQPGAFSRALRQGGRYYYYTRGRRKRKTDSNGP